MEELVLRTLPPVMFMAMQASMAGTSLSIHRSRQVGSLSVFPFVSMFVNSFLWTCYGFLRHDFTVVVPNLTGTIVGLAGVLVFHANAPIESYEHEGKYYYAGASAFTLFGLVSFFYGADQLIGSVAVVMCVVLMGSPLVVLRTVLMDKNCQAMPFWTSLTTWINTLSWMLYGIVVAKDFMIYFPNVCGFILASFQMLLFAIFGIPAESWSGGYAPISGGTKRTVSASVITPAALQGKGPIIPVRKVYSPQRDYSGAESNGNSV
jgi:solute carrier family 50 (sugar transporter)